MPISHTFINRPFSPPAGAGFQLLPSKSTELTQFGGDEISWQLIVYKPKDAMDLISAAGLVAPVMELFTLVLRCLTENKRYVEEFETLCVQLDFQRTCFVEEIRGLLSIISTTNEDSSAMIENPACQLWKDRILDERLGSLFGEWFEKWTSTLNLIYENMYALHDDIKSFMSHFVSNDTRFGKWRQNRKKKVSMAQMQRKVEALEQLVEDFYTVSSQTKARALSVADESSWTGVYSLRTGSLRPPHRYPINPDILTWRENVQMEEQQGNSLMDDIKVCRPTDRVITTSIVIRKASQQLYKALSSASLCKVHTMHYGVLWLDIGARIQGPQPMIRFTLALGGQKKGVTSHLGDFLWFTVDCDIRDSKRLFDSLGTLSDISDLPLKSTRGRDEEGWMKFTLSVEIEDTPAAVSPSIDSLSSTEGATVASAASDDSRADETTSLADVQDLCQTLRLRKSAAHSSWAGILQHANPLKHIICQVNDHLSYSCSTFSLDEALSRTEHSHETITIKEKLRLAKTLAVAVLEYHSTPWLNESWGSGDIFFYSVKDPEEHGLLGIPFLKTLLVEDSREADLYKGRSEKKKSVFGGPNTCLYSLGIVLLELGFDAPLRSLRRDVDLERGQVDQSTNYRTADRLKYLVSKKLGGRYGAVVRKCLDCDFGSGYEFEDAALQDAVFCHVVEELDRCLKAASIA
ncbi:MAG: hypothetical protein FRX48_07412 [Lasallia pustulata]|uniref:DUF7580 domain-containing protein n=1 Tax=Lasallia pustulata TaxID=136370 RepID=A0A5M8PJC0_9LECA|nr:MAG: hypothetical protein FRX48_07412 [Lasallia pustulata]